ncbi:hypothetical protein FOZ61_008033 [Perkinsus olseni]|uniref:Uncharacterized protein n=1 Tax=Perkinsus olseni TaxID=32597 RepID=A0A7J6M830_PEROL|nr:hypothetical protein FOZ61_008033 [Perkinsus olseni]
MSDLISPSLRLLPDAVQLTNRTAIAVHLCILENGYCPEEPHVSRKESGEILLSVVPVDWLQEGVQVFTSRYRRRGGIGREVEVKMVPTGSGGVSVHACKIGVGDEKEIVSGVEVAAVRMDSLDSLRTKVDEMLAKFDPPAPVSVETTREGADQEYPDRRMDQEDENPLLISTNPPNTIRDPTTGTGGVGGLLVGPRDPLFNRGDPQNGPGSLQPHWDPMGPAGFDGEPDYDHEVPPRFNRPPPPGKGFGGMPNLHATSRCTTSASTAAPPKRRRPKPLRRRQSSSDFEMDVARKVTVMGRTISETDINRLGNPKVRVLAKIELSRRYKTFDKATLMSIPSQSRGFVDIKTLQRECVSARMADVDESASVGQVRLNASGSSSAAEVLDEWSHRLARGMGRTPIRRRLDAAAARLSGSPSTPSNRHIRIRESIAPSGTGLRKSATEGSPLSGAVDYIGKNRSAAQLFASSPEQKIRQVQWMGEEREKRMESAFLSRHKPLGIFVPDSDADNELLEPAGRRGMGLLTRSATADSRLSAAGGSIFKRAKSQSNASQLAPQTDMSGRQLKLWQKQWLKFLSAASALKIQSSILSGNIPTDVRLWRVFVIGIYVLRFKSSTRRFKLSRKWWSLAVNAYVRFLRPLWRMRRRVSAARLLRKLLTTTSQAGQLSLSVKRLLWNTRRLQRLWRQFHEDMQVTLRTEWIPAFIKAERQYLTKLYQDNSQTEIVVKKPSQDLIEEWLNAWQRASFEGKGRSKGNRRKGSLQNRQGRRGTVRISANARKSVKVTLNPSVPVTTHSPAQSGARRMSRVNQEPSRDLAAPQQQGGRRATAFRGGPRASVLTRSAGVRRGSLLGSEAEEMMASVSLAQLRARVDAATLHPALRFGLLSMEYCRRMRNKAILARKLVTSMNEALKRLRDWVLFSRMFHLDGQSASLLLVPSTDFNSGMHGDGNNTLVFTASSMMEFVRASHELYGTSAVVTRRPESVSEGRRRPVVTLDVPGSETVKEDDPSCTGNKHSRRESIEQLEGILSTGVVTNLKECFAVAKAYEDELWREALKQEEVAMGVAKAMQAFRRDEE